MPVSRSIALLLLGSLLLSAPALRADEDSDDELEEREYREAIESVPRLVAIDGPLPPPRRIRRAREADMAALEAGWESVQVPVTDSAAVFWAEEALVLEARCGRVVLADDASAIALSCPAADGSQRVVVASPDSSIEIGLSLLEGAHPRLALDGTRVGLLARDETGREALWLLDPKTGAGWRLRSELEELSDLHLSEDGSSVLFSARGGRGPDVVWLPSPDVGLDVEGQWVARNREADLALGLSRDGRRALYWSGLRGRDDVYLVDVGRGSVLNMSDEPGRVTRARLSQDGSSALYEVTYGGVSGLFLADASRRRILPLSESTDAHTGIKTSPNGRTSFFRTGGAAGVVRPAGRNPQLVQSPPGSCEVGWPDDDGALWALCATDAGRALRRYTEHRSP